MNTHYHDTAGITTEQPVAVATVLRIVTVGVAALGLRLSTDQIFAVVGLIEAVSFVLVHRKVMPFTKLAEHAVAAYNEGYDTATEEIASLKPTTTEAK